MTTVVALERSHRSARSLPSSVYLRRRVAMLSAACILAVGTWTVAASAVDVVAPDRAGASGSRGASTADAAPSVHVVAPGDTIWSIATEIAGHGDVRVVVDRLVALNGGPELAVGQQLLVG